MLMLSLDDAVKVAKRLVVDEMDDEEIIRQEMEQKCWLPPSTSEAAKRLNDLIFDINPTEICSQIEPDNLKNWCKIVQTEMKIAMVQLPPIQSERKNGNWVWKDKKKFCPSDCWFPPTGFEDTWNEKEGSWIEKELYRSECNFENWRHYKSNFCPYCGADMRGVTE